MRSLVLVSAAFLAASVFACGINHDSIADGADLGDDDESDAAPGNGSSGSSGRTSSSGASGGGATGSSGAASSGGGSSGGGGPGPAGDLSETFSGESTFYNVNAGALGNCSLPCPDTFLVAALNTDDYEASAMCGGCARVEGPDGDVVVQIWDRCPGCGTHGIDLSKTAFGAISPLAAGRVDVTWAMVRCPWQDPVEYHVFSDRIQVQNHRVPIESIEIERSGAFVALTRRSDNFFTGSIPNAAFTIRVTGMTGEVLEEEVEGRGTFDGTLQFQE